ncbi:MAG: F-type H+-transporting ATPase subunit delta [Patescibacteria group bacterium]|nr:F-type H+-transporting ATPase subunit delta [Patescibacteria group bacterium]
MRITAQQYAQSLYEATKGKSQNEVGGLVEKFTQVLAKNSQLRLKDSIIKKFGSIYNQKNGIVEAEVTSREELEEDVRKYVRTYVMTRYGAKETVLVEKVDKSIGGGVIVRVGDEVMDGSVERQLVELKNILTK